MKFKDELNKLSIYKKTLKEFTKEKYMDENGIIAFDLDYRNKNLNSHISSLDGTMLENFVYDDFERCSDMIPYTYPITFNLKVNGNVDKEEIVRQVQEHYKLKIIDQKRTIKMCFLKALWLLIIGIVFLLTSFLVHMLNVNALYAEIISIIGTFSVWESVDTFLLERMNLNIELANIIQVTNADINIVKEK